MPPSRSTLEKMWDDLELCIFLCFYCLVIEYLLIVLVCVGLIHIGLAWTIAILYMPLSCACFYGWRIWIICRRAQPRPPVDVESLLAHEEAIDVFIANQTGAYTRMPLHVLGDSDSDEGDADAYIAGAETRYGTVDMST